MYGSVLSPDPELEILHQPPSKPVDAPAVLLIHGAYTGAWCWESNFLPHMTQRGLEVHALSLRGHGGSGGHQYLHFSRIRDYARDVRRALQHIGKPTVLVGHSMGGLVVQRTLQQQSVPGAVLMASVPPTGLTRPSMRLALSDPTVFQQLNMVQLGGYHMISARSLRRALFRRDMPLDRVAHYLGHVQSESLSALIDMSGVDLPNAAARIPCKTLVLGGSADALFKISDVEETARAFGVEPIVFKTMPHAMMLDRDWETVADTVTDWVLAL